ncbi:hypothetical protein AK51_00300 [Serratia nematodiphila DZ0503SBS1]|nr:hypothetical protein AK51_00300 [Serratia nematodiphila DZ0503SBS1]
MTLLILIFWPKLGLRVPGHLPALLAGTALMGLLTLFDHPVATIAPASATCWPMAAAARAFRRSCRSCCCPGICRAAAGSRSL